MEKNNNSRIYIKCNYTMFIVEIWMIVFIFLNFPAQFVIFVGFGINSSIYFSEISFVYTCILSFFMLGRITYSQIHEINIKWMCEKEENMFLKKILDLPLSIKIFDYSMILLIHRDLYFSIGNFNCISMNYSLFASIKRTNLIRRYFNITYNFRSHSHYNAHYLLCIL